MTSDTPANTTTFGNWPHRIIRRSDTVRPLPPHTRSLADLTLEVGDRSLSVSDCMTRCRTAGVLILKGGEIALERYGMESGPGRRRAGYSTTKSIVATLVGAALRDGAIGSLDDCCELYVPRLRGSAYEGVTVRNVMRMCSGVAWDEEGDGRADSGQETGGFGFSACLRDLGRFGLLALEDGMAFGGRQILPSGWRDLIGQPDSAPTGFGRLTPGSPMGYGYHWWAVPHGPTGIHAGAFLAAGAFGQYDYVHPAARVVAAVQSAWRQHEDPDANAGTWALLGAALRALRAT